MQAVRLSGHNATLFNLLCLAVDHYCAIARPLTYSVFMSKRRVHVILALSWVLSLLFGFSDFYISAPIQAPLHGHCEHVELSGQYCRKVRAAKKISNYRGNLLLYRLEGFSLTAIRFHLQCFLMRVENWI